MADCDGLKVPFSRPALGPEEKKAVCDVLDSGWLTTGKITLAFEQEFAARLGCAHALAVNSNTSGMILAMEACGVTEGTAVITTPYTFVSTATSARHLGAEVLFADIEADSYSIDPEQVERLLQQDTEHRVRAIVPVHVAGNICNMSAICALAKKYSTPDARIRVIEDAAHAFPSPTPLGYAGTIGDAGVFSFYVTKTITTGEGGMVTTNDDELARRMTTMRMHGMDRTTWDRYTSPRASWEYDIIAPGYKFNLPDLLSAIGREQLKKADTFYRQRREIVDAYTTAFSKLDFISLPPDGPGNAWHLYLIRLVPEKLTIDRAAFARELQARGIGISMHFIALFHFTYWRERYPSFRPENYPNAEAHFQQTLTLPLWPGMTREMIDEVITAVTETGLRSHAR